MSGEMKVQTKGLNKKFLIIATTLILVGIIAALVLLLPTSAKAKKVEEQLNLGAKYLSELDYEQAIVAYEAVIKIDPKCEEAYLALADIYIATGELEKAEEILKQAEEAIGEDVTASVEAKKQAVEKVREEQNQAEVPSPIPSPTAIPTPTNTPSPTPTNTPSPTPTNTPSPTPTNTPSPSPTNTPTPPPTNAPTPTPVNTPSPIPMATPVPDAHTIYDGTIVELAKAKVGDVVLFGTYEQDNIESNGAEAIPWYVLDKDGDKLLLMSVYLLDCIKYHEERESITWEYCTLRQWMNDDFYNYAFTKSEKKHILTSYLKNEDNPYYGTDGGNDTEDKVFALSLEEADRYFEIAEGEGLYRASESPELSGAEVTMYAEAQGVLIPSTGDSKWWLRSPGGDGDYGAAILSDGDVLVYGINVGYGRNAVRPALWFALTPSTKVSTSTNTPIPTPTNTPSPTPTGIPFPTNQISEESEVIKFSLPEEDSVFILPVTVVKASSALEVKVFSERDKFDAHISYVVRRHDKKDDTYESIGSVGVALYASDAIKDDNVTSFYVPDGGEYEIKIENSVAYNPHYYSGTNINELCISYRIISPDDNETNETYETATEIANGEYCFFTLLGEKDTDWFELELTEEFSKLSVEIGTATGRFEAPIVYSVSKYNEETGELDSVGSVWGMYASNALKRDDKRSYNISGVGKYYVRVLNASQANSLYYSGDNESYLYLRCTGINVN